MMTKKTLMTLAAVVGLAAISAIPAMAQAPETEPGIVCLQHETANMAAETMQPMMSAGSMMGSGSMAFTGNMMSAANGR